jgi:hypothetical protein
VDLSQHPNRLKPLLLGGVRKPASLDARVDVDGQLGFGRNGSLAGRRHGQERRGEEERRQALGVHQLRDRPTMARVAIRA